MLLLSGCAGQSTTTPTPTASAGGWKRVWFDGFDGAAGSLADPRRWTADTGGDGWGNQELQYYTSGTANASVDGHGSLALVARPDASGHSC